MNRRRPGLLAAAVATIAGGFLAVAVAQAVTPPAGTPDLSQMVLATSDLGPGAKIAVSRYTAPGANTIANYERSFSGAKTTAGVKLDVLTSSVLLANSTGSAVGLYGDLKLVYSSSLGHKLLVAAIVKASGKVSAISAKDVHFGKQTSAGVGAQSLNQTIVIRVKRKAVAADFVVFRIGDVLGSVTVVALRAGLPHSVASGLAATEGEHITAVLAASGSTGPTGSTGATGATG